MARSNRAARRRRRNGPHPERDARLALEPAPILAGLPGGETYVSERELEQFAMTMFEAVAAMHPGMEARKQAAERWRIDATPPRVEPDSGLVQVTIEQAKQYVPDKRRRSAQAYLGGFHA
jgi:hypothetical protein